MDSSPIYGAIFVPFPTSIPRQFSTMTTNTKLEAIVRAVTVPLKDSAVEGIVTPDGKLRLPEPLPPNLPAMSEDEKQAQSLLIALKDPEVRAEIIADRDSVEAIAQAIEVEVSLPPGNMYPATGTAESRAVLASLEMILTKALTGAVPHWSGVAVATMSAGFRGGESASQESVRYRLGISPETWARHNRPGVARFSAEPAAEQSTAENVRRLLGITKEQWDKA